ncbi:MAG: DUF2911 domain-containing protein [Blastocatellia bacterium]
MFKFRRNLLSSFAVISLIVCAAQFASAQLRLPRPSSKASVMQTVGVTDVTITYSRPAVKGRTIWGDAPADAKGEGTLDDSRVRPAGMPIVPYGHIWRTGANEATQFVVTDDVLINGSPLAAGTYSLHTIPGRDEWVIVFNGTANQWGSFNYDPKKDTLRVKAKPQVSDHSHEWLDISLDPVNENSLVAKIKWEKISVPFTIEVKDVAATTLAKARVAVAAAKADDWQTPFQAANYAKTNKATADAEKWYEQSLKAIDELIKVKENFQNLSRKATILLGAGKKDEGLAVAEKAVVVGKAEKADTAPLEKRIADIKAGKL